MNQMIYVETALAAAISVGSILLLAREKKKYGSGLAAKTAHTASRYKMLWLLAYVLAIPSAIVIHILHLLERTYIAIGRLTLTTTQKIVYIIVGLTLWIAITIIRLAKYIGQKTWEWLA